MATLVFDVETYRNFFLALFRDVDTGAVIRVQISPNRTLNHNLLLRTVSNNLLVGFNSADFDIPMLQLALKGYSPAEIKEAADDIIKRGVRPYDVCKAHNLNKPSWNHVDLINVAPLDASLKLYGGRLHCKKLQDLPIDPDKELTADEAAQIAEYCLNDLDITATLWDELSEQIKLREELSKVYKQDLRSRSDAQVAEAIIANEITKLNGSRPVVPKGLEGKEYRYRVPDFIKFSHPDLVKLLNTIRESLFTVGPSGSIVLPEALSNYVVKLNGGKYRIGIGGLHSSESQTWHQADDEVMLIDRDVTSYYPSIILGLGLYPQHLGEAFLTVYRSLVERRVAAKKAGDKVTAESLKIAVNGSFGKLGSKYSVLYSPDLLIQVTITGQLCLLMLIEMVEEFGLRVISANTDGIVIRCPKKRYDLLCSIIKRWEDATGFGTEETCYKAIYSKDVNNYIAIKTDGKTKNKGLYANPWETGGKNIFKLHKNPSTTIVIEAVCALLKDGTPLEDTIRACKDIRKFTAVRTVTGGATVNGRYLGKCVRWYYAKDSKQVMNYRKTGNKVPKSDNSKPLMELPEAFPDDVNVDWYITEARATLANLGYSQGTLFGH